MMPGVALVYAACCALCAAMPRHWQQMLPGRSPATAVRSLLRIAGWLLMAAGLHACMRDLGVGTGMVAFFGLLTLVAPCLAIMLAYAPRLALVLLAAMPLAWL